MANLLNLVGRTIKAFDAGGAHVSEAGDVVASLEKGERRLHLKYVCSEEGGELRRVMRISTTAYNHKEYKWFAEDQVFVEDVFDVEYFKLREYYLNVHENHVVSELEELLRG